MNSIFKAAIMFTTGMVVGAGIAAIVTKKYFENESAQEIDIVKKHYAHVNEERLRSNKVKVHNEAQRIAAVMLAESLGYESPADMPSPEIPGGDIPPKVEEVVSEPEVVVPKIIRKKSKPTIKRPTLPAESEIDKNAPYLISEEAFVTPNGNKKVDLVYYEQDDVLADTNDRPVIDDEKLVGNCLQHFSDEGVSTIYIHAPAKGADVMVELERATYAEVVGGIRMRQNQNRKFRDDD